MAKKNFTWKLDEDLVSKIQKLAEKEHRSLTNYIEVMFIEALKEAKFITSNTVLCDSGCDCPISNTDKVHFCDKCTPKMYGC